MNQQDEASEEGCKSISSGCKVMIPIVIRL